MRIPAMIVEMKNFLNSYLFLGKNLRTVSYQTTNTVVGSKEFVALTDD
jgi:hypothetical protein